MAHLLELTKRYLVASGLALMEVSSGMVPVSPESLLQCGRVLVVGIKVSSVLMILKLSTLLITLLWLRVFLSYYQQERLLKTKRRYDIMSVRESTLHKSMITLSRYYISLNNISILCALKLLSSVRLHIF